MWKVTYFLLIWHQQVSSTRFLAIWFLVIEVESLNSNWSHQKTSWQLKPLPFPLILSSLHRTKKKQQPAIKAPIFWWCYFFRGIYNNKPGFKNNKLNTVVTVLKINSLFKSIYLISNTARGFIAKWHHALNCLALVAHFCIFQRDLNKISLTKTFFSLMSERARAVFNAHSLFTRDLFLVSHILNKCRYVHSKSPNKDNRVRYLIHFSIKVFVMQIMQLSWIKFIALAFRFRQIKA